MGTEDPTTTSDDASRERGRQALQFYQEFIDDCDLGHFSGTFDDWLAERTEEEAVALLEDMHNALDSIPEEDPTGADVLSFASDGEPQVVAHISCASPDQSGLFYRLVSPSHPDFSIVGPEQLLSALEACGVDNCRIEVEAGDGSSSGPVEPPMLDSSSVGWVEFIMRAGQCLAKDPAGGDTPVHRGVAILPAGTNITNGDGDAYVSALSSKRAAVSCGVDWADVPFVGRSWFSWCPEGDQASYVVDVAPAPLCLKSMDRAVAYRAAGQLKGAGEANVSIADGNDWMDARTDRFGAEDPARHEVSDMIGTLALLAQNGHAGVPRAHVSTWEADAGLKLQLVQALSEVIQWE